MKLSDDEEFFFLSGELIDMPLIEAFGYHDWKKAIPQNWHQHVGIEINMFADGGGSFELDTGQIISLSGGRFFLAAAHQPHRAENNVLPPSKQLWIEVKTDPNLVRDTTLSSTFLELFAERSESCRGLCFSYSHDVARLLERMHSVMVDFEKDEGSVALRTLLRSLICQIIVEIYQCLPDPSKTKLQQSVPAAIEYLDQHYLADITVDDISEALSLTRNSVFDQFRIATGFSPHDYLQRLRIKHAQRLMADKKLNITEIAFASGFNSSNYFAIAFKKYTRQTPKEYRNAILQVQEVNTAIKQGNVKARQHIEVDLSTHFNAIAIYSKGTKFGGGFDHQGYAYAANLIPNPLYWCDTPFKIGAANIENVVIDHAQTVIILPGRYSILKMLASATGGKGWIGLTLNYSDKTTTHFDQDVSSWQWAYSQKNESNALIMWECHCEDGTCDYSHAYYIYGYSFDVDPSKTLESITLSETNTVAIFSMDLTALSS